MYSAYKFSKQGDNTQPCHTPFSILNQSVVVPCQVLTVILDLDTGFSRDRLSRSGIPISLRIFQFALIHIVKGFSIVNEADIFLEFSCFSMIQLMLAI